MNNRILSFEFQNMTLMTHSSYLNPSDISKIKALSNINSFSCLMSGFAGGFVAYLAITQTNYLRTKLQTKPIFRVAIPILTGLTIFSIRVIQMRLKLISTFQDIFKTTPAPFWRNKEKIQPKIQGQKLTPQFIKTIQADYILTQHANTPSQFLYQLY